FHFDSADRVQLPVPDANIISRQFQPRDSLVVSYLPLRDGGMLAVINTSLTTARLASDTTQKQVPATETLQDKLEAGG
ncbi:endonuclease/exonuclease/phosphatase family protein, partial [Pseudomonas syringae pv. tagetis]